MNRVNNLFKDNGIKATAQRLIIYKALEKLGHANVEDVASEVHLQVPTISLSTVYNTLESFCDSKIITKLYTKDNKSYYDITTNKHHHLLSFEPNNIIKDYNDDELTKIILNYISNKNIKNFTLQDINIQLIGEFK